MLKVAATIESGQDGSGSRVACPACGAMMMLVEGAQGVAVVRIKCRRCKRIVSVKISEY